LAYHFKNLVFEGGGVKGIAYLGALEELERRGIGARVERVGGTSAGAINAVLVGLNHTLTETQELLWRLDFKSFLDDSWGIVRDTQRLIESYGWYKGDFFRAWIGSVVRAKTGNSESTFADLEAMKPTQGFKSLYLVGTNLSTGFAEVFSAEHTPRMCVADAARISMSIPLFFAAKRSTRGDVYVDGGVLDNYPVKLFDREKYLGAASERPVPSYYARVNAGLAAGARPVSRYAYNKETLGFRLDSREEIAMFRDHAEPPERPIGDFFEYAWALVETILNAQDSAHLHSDDWQRTIYIDTLGVGTTQFDIDEATKHRLVQSGRDGVAKYFEWYDAAPQAANK